MEIKGMNYLQALRCNSLHSSWIKSKCQLLLTGFIPKKASDIMESFYSTLNKMHLYQLISHRVRESL